MTADAPVKRTLTQAERNEVNGVSSRHAERVHNRIALALDLASDGRKVERLAARLCRWCFYVTSVRITGQAFTHWKCVLCPFEGLHHNTGVPALCGECSDGFGLCFDCGGDLDMRFRRVIKRRPKKKPRATVPRGFTAALKSIASGPPGTGYALDPNSGKWVRTRAP